MDLITIVLNHITKNPPKNTSGNQGIRIFHCRPHYFSQSENLESGLLAIKTN